MYCNELFANRNNANLEELNSRMKTFPVDSKYPMPVKVEGIPFSSTCEHHWMPFIGTVDVRYVPSDRIIGLSKIPRVVEYFSKKPQLQERLTSEIGEYLVKVLNPKKLEVRIQAIHTCVLCRGIESSCDTQTVFNYERGDNQGEVI